MMCEEQKEEIISSTKQCSALSEEFKAIKELNKYKSIILHKADEGSALLQ